jgi:eukaryotic-like serine/threonine-protein kinase
LKPVSIVAFGQDRFMAMQIECLAEPIPGYRLLERIGGGGFGDVWKAEAPGGLHKAIKVIHGDLRNADPDGARHAEQELKALKRVQAIRHPYLLSLERYDIVDGKLLIVMELADCNLWDRFRDCRSQGLPGIPREELLGYLEESAEVLDLFNNQHGLQHLDIKPQNLFLIHNHVKVADFGLVKDLEGVRAALTGGVTPVYAAPETFDGVATRFCDQYSLAIVYQELLTGVRPFNGANSQQLLMQHMQGLPNLTPLPPADRAAVGRALSKKPEDRFPTCLQFVRNLRQAGADQIGGAYQRVPASNMGKLETPGAGMATVGSYARLPSATYPPPQAPPETPRTELRNRATDSTSSPAVDIVQAAVEEPLEEVGPGALVPAVIIGIGQLGIEVVQRFSRQVVDRYGSFERVANLRLICIDTDPETLQAATAAQSGMPLAPSQLIPMRLNRASHYLKPRRNGRSLIEGWFDPQTLYRIPRNPQTLGLRCLGRLAFCDHYPTFAERFREDLNACIQSEALDQADRLTKLGLRSNRPRVYVVAGLGGGTGSGMFLDVAYVVRQRLRQLGYRQPEVVGILLAPSPDRTGLKPHTIANTFAALKELNHFSSPETVFVAVHEERDGCIHDPLPPFSRTFVLPSDVPPSPTEPQPAGSAQIRAAEFLRRDLLSPLGRVADDSRAEFEEASTKAAGTVCVPNQGAFTWPKQAILTKASRWLGENLVYRWMKADVGAIREPVRTWLKERWNTEQLGPEPILAQLQATCDKAAGKPFDQLIAEEVQPFVPRGWFSRDPDPARLWQSVLRMQHIVGMPDEHAMQRQTGKLEQLLHEAAENIVRELGPKLLRMPRMLLEHPDYRLGGALEAIEQLQAILTQLHDKNEPLATESAGKAIDSYYFLHNFVSAERGRRKTSPAEIADHFRNFPKWRVHSLVHRQLCRIYLQMRSQLTDLAREFQFCRERLDDLTTRFKQVPSEPRPENETFLFPTGCSSVDSAVKALCESIKADELRALDKTLQRQIEKTYQALFSVCMSSINMLGNLHGVVEEQARAFLAAKLGDSNVGEMFFARFADGDSAVKAVRQIYEQAAPPLRINRPITQEICILAVPDGDSSKAFQKTAGTALAGKPLDFTVSTEEILVYREWPRFPFASLPQLGPMATDAYNQMQQSGQGLAHSRSDIGQWHEIER